MNEIRTTSIFSQPILPVHLIKFPDSAIGILMIHAINTYDIEPGIMITFTRAAASAKQVKDRTKTTPDDMTVHRYFPFGPGPLGGPLPAHPLFLFPGPFELAAEPPLSEFPGPVPAAIFTVPSRKPSGNPVLPAVPLLSRRPRQPVPG